MHFSFRSTWADLDQHARVFLPFLCNQNKIVPINVGLIVSLNTRTVTVRSNNSLPHAHVSSSSMTKCRIQLTAASRDNKVNNIYNSFSMLEVKKKRRRRRRKSFSKISIQVYRSWLGYKNVKPWLMQHIIIPNYRSRNYLYEYITIFCGATKFFSF